MLRAMVLCSSLLWAGGCGADSLLVFEVTSDLTVPAELNNIVLEIHDIDQTTTYVTVEREVSSLPITIEVTPEESWGQTLRVEARGLLDTASVATIVADFSWVVGSDSVIAVGLLTL